jgi:hypothetical protein
MNGHRKMRVNDAQTNVKMDVKFSSTAVAKPGSAAGGLVLVEVRSEAVCGEKSDNRLVPAWP